MFPQDLGFNNNWFSRWHVIQVHNTLSLFSAAAAAAAAGYGYGDSTSYAGYQDQSAATGYGRSSSQQRTGFAPYQQHHHHQWWSFCLPACLLLSRGTSSKTIGSFSLPCSHSPTLAWLVSSHTLALCFVTLRGTWNLLHDSKIVHCIVLPCVFWINNISLSVEQCE